MRAAALLAVLSQLDAIQTALCFLLLLKVSHINPVVYCAQERANPESVTFEAYAFFIQEAKS